jgi:hypothetical protein
MFANVRRLFDAGFDRFNALHVINERTVSSLDDMLAPETVAPFRSIMLQPYIATQNHGVNRISGLGLEALLDAVASNVAFRNERRAFLLVDCEHLEQAGLAPDDFLRLVGRLGISEKVRFFPSDPLLHGLLRVTYDGYVLAPLDSLHPALYGQTAVARLGSGKHADLDDLFAGLLSRGGRFRFPHVAPAGSPTGGPHASPPHRLAIAERAGQPDVREVETCLPL